MLRTKLSIQMLNFWIGNITKYKVLPVKFQEKVYKQESIKYFKYGILFASL